MTSFLSSAIERLAGLAGGKLLRAERWRAMEAERRALLEMLKRRTPDRPGSSAPAACVVFSMNRPMQLAATLASMVEMVRPLPSIHVLFRATNPAFARAYEEVLAAFAGRASSFPEREFRSDLISILNGIPEHRIFFLVDDIIFVEPVNLVPLAALDSEMWTPSLRLGRNLRYCYTSDRKQPLPPLRPMEAGGDLFAWHWKEGAFDWGYPLSVDGNLFSTREISLLAEICDYKAPNSFEAALQNFKTCFSERSGVCLGKSRLVNIPCNKVQTENNNRSGAVTADYLLAKWNEGLAIDHRAYYGVENISAHQELALVFAGRSSLGYEGAVPRYEASIPGRRG